MIDREEVLTHDVEVGTVRTSSDETYVLRWLDVDAVWSNTLANLEGNQITRHRCPSRYMDRLDVEDVTGAFLIDTHGQGQVAGPFIHRIQIDPDIPITSHPLAC